MRQRWIQINGEFISADQFVAPENNAPLVMADIQPYRSMLTGEMINSRSVHRAHLRDHGCIEVGNETQYLKPKPMTSPKGLKETLIRVTNDKLRS